MMGETAGSKGDSRNRGAKRAGERRVEVAAGRGWYLCSRPGWHWPALAGSPGGWGSLDG